MLFPCCHRKGPSPCDQRYEHHDDRRDLLLDFSFLRIGFSVDRVDDLGDRDSLCGACGCRDPDPASGMRGAFGADRGFGRTAGPYFKFALLRFFRDSSLESPEPLERRFPTFFSLRSIADPDPSRFFAYGAMDVFFGLESCGASGDIPDRALLL